MELVNSHRGDREYRHCVPKLSSRKLCSTDMVRMTQGDA